MKGRDTLHVHAPIQPEVQEIVSEYEFLVEQMRQSVWRLDATGKVIEANSAACKWLGVGIEDLVGKNLSEFLTLEVDMVRDEVFEAEFVTVDNIKRIAVVSSRALRHENGMLLGALQVVTDVTANRAIDTRLVKEIQKMARMAGEDSLTGLPNRRAFDIMLENAQAGATNEPFALMLIDLNDFKPVNDTFGHSVGDKALVAFSEKLEDLTRDSDFLARIGGDEFIVVLHNADRTAAENAAKRFSDALDFVMDVEGEIVRLWCSVGLAHSADGSDSVLERADSAMYEAKRQLKAVGRNGIDADSA